jgi:hypothetical protein
MPLDKLGAISDTGDHRGVLPIPLLFKSTLENLDKNADAK